MVVEKPLLTRQTSGSIFDSFPVSTVPWNVPSSLHPDAPKWALSQSRQDRSSPANSDK
jgi:hypothetical protein